MSPAAPPARTEARDTAVMVVDDQSVFRKVAKAVVDGTPGFELVAEASSGREALERVAELPVDFVLMDVRMPGMDGIETTRALTSSHPDTVVVLISLDELGDVVTAANSCGAVAFVRKQDFGPRMLRGLWSVHGRRRSVSEASAPAP